MRSVKSGRFLLGNIAVLILIIVSFRLPSVLAANILGSTSNVVLLAFDRWFSPFASFVGGSISLLLTALLAVLYYRQQQLKAAEYKVIIQSLDYRFPDNSKSIVDLVLRNRDNIRYLLSNSETPLKHIKEVWKEGPKSTTKIEFQIGNNGNGMATDLQLRTELLCRVDGSWKYSEEINFAEEGNELRITPHTTSLRRINHDAKLRPGETLEEGTKEWFEATVKQMIRVDGETLSDMVGEKDPNQRLSSNVESGYSARFREFMDILQDNGVEVLNMHLYVEYQNEIDVDGEEHLMGIQGIDPEKSYTLQRATEDNPRTSPSPVPTQGKIARIKTKLKDVVSY